MKAETQPPTFQDLVDHAGWIRALARSLVTDPSLVEDVMQDAWVAALERPPVRNENLRGWLATVVRNTVRMRGRSAGRRVAHESQAVEERETTVPSSAELAERIETQKRLASLVLQLDEPYRKTVLLRYYEGMSSQEIARCTGAKAGTIRWRLSHGLRELRGKLDDDFGGERAAWMGLLLPLAEKGVALAASTAGGTGLLSGIFAMNLGLKITFSLAAIAAAFYFSPLRSTTLLRIAEDTPAPVKVSFHPLPTVDSPGELKQTPEPTAGRVALAEQLAVSATEAPSG